ncbi:hypothetical protein IP88_16665, partial [alpha proteobacterium AAP81b]
MMRRWWLLAALAAALLAVVFATAPAPVPDFAGLAGGGSEALLLARDGRVLDRRRTDGAVRRLAWVPLAAVSPAVVRRLQAAEDRRFLEHGGVDWRGVGGALRAQLTGGPNRGASTITMQLAALLDPRLGRAGARGVGQKLIQARAALAIEARWSKAQILEAWLNLLPFRGELVGIDAAARGLAGRSPAALSEAEAAVLVALARGPSAAPAVVV